MKKYIVILLCFFIILGCNSTVKVEKNGELYISQLDKFFDEGKWEDIPYLLENHPNDVPLDYYRYLVQFNFKNKTLKNLETKYLKERDSVEKYYVLAMLSYLGGVYNYEKSEIYINQGFKLIDQKNLTPDIAEYYFLASMVFDGIEKQDIALEMLEKAEKLKDLGKYKLFRANILMKKSDYSGAQIALNNAFPLLDKQKDIEKGNQLIQSLFLKRKNLPEELKLAHLKWIWGLESGKNIYPILKTALKAKDKYPGVSEIYSVIGFAYYLMDNKTDAFIYLEKSIALDPADYMNYFHLGIIYFYLQQYNEAYDYFKKALDLNRYNQLTYSYLSKIEAALGNYDNAITYKESELKIQKSLEIYLELETLFQKGRDTFQRRELLEKIITLYPETPDPYERMASLYEEIFYNEVNPDLRKKWEEKLIEYQRLFKEKESAKIEKEMVKSETTE
ncbi:tetratricopeptide repeat protein [bacterium]|nr:tetratricopeptide repeat protein [bacterium]